MESLALGDVDEEVNAMELEYILRDVSFNGLELEAFARVGGIMHWEGIGAAEVAGVVAESRNDAELATEILASMCRFPESRAAVAGNRDALSLLIRARKWLAIISIGEPAYVVMSETPDADKAMTVLFKTSYAPEKITPDEVQIMREAFRTNHSVLYPRGPKTSAQLYTAVLYLKLEQRHFPTADYRRSTLFADVVHKTFSDSPETLLLVSHPDEIGSDVVSMVATQAWTSDAGFVDLFVFSLGGNKDFWLAPLQERRTADYVEFRARRLAGEIVERAARVSEPGFYLANILGHYAEKGVRPGRELYFRQ